MRQIDTSPLDNMTDKERFDRVEVFARVQDFLDEFHAIRHVALVVNHGQPHVHSTPGKRVYDIVTDLIAEAQIPSPERLPDAQPDAQPEIRYDDVAYRTPSWIRSGRHG